jgi:hypothetical protein
LPSTPRFQHPPPHPRPPHPDFIYSEYLTTQRRSEFRQLVWQIAADYASAALLLRLPGHVPMPAFQVGGCFSRPAAGRSRLAGAPALRGALLRPPPTPAGSPLAPNPPPPPGGRGRAPRRAPRAAAARRGGSIAARACAAALLAATRAQAPAAPPPSHAACAPASPSTCTCKPPAPPPGARRAGAVPRVAYRCADLRRPPRRADRARGLPAAGVSWSGGSALFWGRKRGCSSGACLVACSADSLALRSAPRSLLKTLGRPAAAAAAAAAAGCASSATAASRSAPTLCRPTSCWRPPTRTRPTSWRRATASSGRSDTGEAAGGSPLRGGMLTRKVRRPREGQEQAQQPAQQATPAHAPPLQNLQTRLSPRRLALPPPNSTMSECLAHSKPLVFVRRDFFNEEPFLRKVRADGGRRGDRWRGALLGPGALRPARANQLGPPLPAGASPARHAEHALPPPVPPALPVPCRRSWSCTARRWR